MGDRLLVCIAGASMLALASPVCADELATVKMKLAAAAAEVRSFVLEMRVNGTTGVNGTVTFVRPLKIKSEFNMGETTVDTYVVDGMLYLYNPASGWQKMKLDEMPLTQQSVNIADSMNSSKVTLLADRQEDGVTVGVVQVETQLPAAGPVAQQAPQQIVCSYDKTSYQLKICTNSIMTMTYTKYNDRANTVVLPPGAENAVPIVAASPPASAEPVAPLSPGPSPAATPLPVSPPPASPPPASPAPGG